MQFPPASLQYPPFDFDLTMPIHFPVIQVEVGEWALLLGFARYLTSSGLLEPPCNLPKPHQRVNNNGASSVDVGTRHSQPGSKLMKKGQSKLFQASIQQVRASETLALTTEDPSSPMKENNQQTRSQRLKEKFKLLNETDKIETVRGCRRADFAVPSWFSVEKDLCEVCWAMRVGASSSGSSKCQRCGKQHRRGFAQGRPGKGVASSITGNKSEIVGPVIWQNFREVRCRNNGVIECAGF